MMEIQIRDDDIERFRERLRKLSDSELIALGKRVRYLADPRMQCGKPNPAFVEQLKEARESGGGGILSRFADW